TTFHEFRSDTLTLSSDGRPAERAYLWREHVYLWDGTTSTPQTQPIVAGGAGMPVPSFTFQVPSVGLEVRRERNLDALDNEVSAIDYGTVGIDNAIAAVRSFQLPTSDQTAWSYRVTDVQAGYATVSSGPSISFTGPVRETQYAYYPSGLLQ